MAPVTRSKVAREAASPKASGSKSKNPKASAAAPPKKPAATSGPKPAGVKKGKGRKKNASKKPASKKSKGKEPAGRPSEDDEDYSSELAQTYEILPHLNNAGGSSRSAAGRPSSSKSNSSSLKSGNGSDWERMRRKPEYVDLTGSTPPTSARGSRNASQRPSSDRPRVKQEPESSSPPSPVSVRNAHVFRFLTIGAVRQERVDLLQQMTRWARTLDRTRARFVGFFDVVTANYHFGGHLTNPIARVMVEFEDVIRELEQRVGILDALNRAQAPLRRAPLGNGRKRR